MSRDNSKLESTHPVRPARSTSQLSSPNNTPSELGDPFIDWTFTESLQFDEHASLGLVLDVGGSGSSPEARAVPSAAQADNDDASIELDQSSQLLSMTTTASPSTQFADPTGADCTITSAVHLGGVFFGPATQSDTQTAHLTCYRRSLFQISGTVVCFRDVSGASTRSLTDRKRIHGLRASLTATETTKGDPVKLVVVPSKQQATWRAAGTAAQTCPSALDIDLSSASARQPNGYSTYNLAWLRLQFRASTEKRGRRRDKRTEQHFILHVCITATLDDGTEALLNRQSSLPIAVRGRSPINFTAPKKSAPLQNVVPNEGPISMPARNLNPQGLSEPRHSKSEPTVVNRASSSIETYNQSQHMNQGDMDSSHIPWVWNDDASDLFLPDDHQIQCPVNRQTHDNLDDFLSQFWSPTFLATELENMRKEPLPYLDDTLDVATLQPFEIGKPYSASMDHTTPASLFNPPLPDKSSKPGQYEYFPLSLEDRTPPVLAVFHAHRSHLKIKAMKTALENLHGQPPTWQARAERLLFHHV